MAPGRNAPCPCGSGRKYKQCCLKTGDKRARRRFFIILAAGLVAAVATGILVGTYTTTQYGAGAAVVCLAVLAGYALLRNPPKSQGRTGADRIDFGR